MRRNVMRWGVLVGGLLGGLSGGLLGGVSEARADMMCGGARPPPMAPAAPSGSGDFAKPPPPPPQGALEPGSRPPTRGTELGMLASMLALGCAAGVASRGKKGS